VSSARDHFDKFESHTLLKHRILQAYLAAWALKLLKSGRNQRVHFIDAFAGEGRDGEGNPGSPLIAAQVANEVAGAMALPGEAPRKRVGVYAIETMPSRVAALRECLAPFGPTHPGHVEIHSGELPTFIDRIVERTGNEPALYFLDPFGIKGLNATTYPKALRGPQNEVFALFADLGAGRLYGLVTSQGKDVSRKLAVLRDRPSLFAEWDRVAEAALATEVVAHRRALDASQPASREHLTTALGGDLWQSLLRGEPTSRRPAVFLGLFMDRLIEDGARLVLPIPLRDENGDPKYTLVHASKSATAFATMKEAVSGALSKDLLPAEIVEMIRQDLLVDEEEVLRWLAEAFAGMTVSWSKVVRERLLLETGIFNFQTNQILLRLVAGGVVPADKKGGAKRPIICSFPNL
jgi:three-Cys-motif partner protein